MKEATDKSNNLQVVIKKRKKILDKMIDKRMAELNDKTLGQRAKFSQMLTLRRTINQPTKETNHA